MVRNTENNESEPQRNIVFCACIPSVAESHISSSHRNIAASFQILNEILSFYNRKNKQT